MPRFVGLDQSNFDPERYRRECCDSPGGTLPPQGVLDDDAFVRAFESSLDAFFALDEAAASLIRTKSA